ncbi:type I-E CRISPR-associated protein Cse1/CasA [Streptomyces sp. 21So2-11]|uniref:type I-E CRISPR-associated protein Cse1/CasA n=1 Tax=Streptomyces sp. 21So2-11 TaxID=3144408 RepID=UPI00321C1250
MRDDPAPATDHPEKEASFDLTDRPWLPVLLLDGTETELSLREVFAQAREIRRLAGDVPTQDFALLRLLLAILHDALDGPRDLDDWAELWEGDEPFSTVPGYLDQHRERFDLLHPVQPFFQVADLRTAKDEVFGLNRIVADVPNGHPFFTTRFPGVEKLSLAEAARWVVHAHAYDTSGIKTGVQGDPRVKGGKAYPQGVGWAGNLGGITAEGADLRETLLLNLIAADSRSADGPGADLPAWRRPPCGPGAADTAGRPAGVRDLYTWQSRRIRLHHDAASVHGVVLTYGDPLAQQNMQESEPMTGWRRSAAQEKKLGRPLVYMPREHDPSRSAWRGLEALIAPRDQSTAAAGDAPSAVRPAVVVWLARLTTERVLPKQTLIRLRTCGAVYGTQQSVIDEITEDALAMAVVLLGESDQRLAQEAIDAVADAERAVTALGDLATDLTHAAGGESDSGRSTARHCGFAALDGPYRNWLAALHPGVNAHERRVAWQRTARRESSCLAEEQLAGAGEAAWEGRVVDQAKGQAWLNTASAELWFRFRLKRCLPLAYESATADGSGPSPSGTKTPETSETAAITPPPTTDVLPGPESPKVPA